MSDSNQRRILHSLNKLRLVLSYLPYFRSKESIRFVAWANKHYGPFGKKQRVDVMLSSARFLNINRPISGHYFEFGSHGANTIRYAWKYLNHLIDGLYVAFDSFEGLPEVSEKDKSTIFFKGNLSTPIETFRRLATKGNGIPHSKLMTVQGFYSETLNQITADLFGSKKAAVIYVDCDLYESAVDVLNFSLGFLQHGTVLIFDDWNCYSASPELGERRAFEEFSKSQHRYSFVPFFSSAEIQAFICQDLENAHG